MMRNFRPEIQNFSGRSIITWFPIVFFQCYLSFTVLIYAFGPWPWPTHNPIILYSFLFLIQLFLFLGYYVGLKIKIRSYSNLFSIKKLIIFSIVINIIWIYPTFNLRSGSNIEISSILTTIWNGITNPGGGYSDKIKNATFVRSTTILEYVTQVINPILWIMTPLCVFFWSKISFITKLFFLFCVIANLASWISIGTNKGIFDFVLMTPFLILASRPYLIANLNRKRLFIGLMTSISAAILLFSQFSNSMASRGGGEAFAFDEGANIPLDSNNWMLMAVPENARGSAGALISYMSQGYYPLSLALDEPFVFSYGVGNSYYYTGIVESFVGHNFIADKTYPARIEYTGWGSKTKWHSIYTWIASDITFYGVLIFVFFIGWLLSLAWMESVVAKNPFAISFLPLIILMLFYFPANNQILAFSETSNAFYFILVIWLLSRRRALLIK